MGEESRVLKVQMLGGFSMTWEGKWLQIGKHQATKTIQLLQLLLHAGAEGISRLQLLDYLFGRDAEGDIANNLRVTVHNLRRMLISAELPDENYIHVSGGRYYFVSSFSVKIDARVFEETVKAAEKAEEGEKLKLLKEACRLYTGHFLPGMSCEEWAAVAGAHYQRLYTHCMEEVYNRMKEREEYAQLLQLCSQAAALYPFDDWQTWQIDCLLAMNRPKDALALYDKTTAMYFDELGLPPSEHMMERFHQMSGQIRLNTGELSEIRESIKEKGRLSGAYYCSYPSFVDSYRMVVRLMEGSEQPAYLMLCTISDEKGKLLENPDRLKAVSDGAAEAIRGVLGDSDVFTRYSMSQFLAIMMKVRKEDCTIITNRIESDFRKKENSRRIRLTFRMMPATGGQTEKDGNSFL